MTFLFSSIPNNRATPNPPLPKPATPTSRPAISPRGPVMPHDPRAGTMSPRSGTFSPRPSGKPWRLGVFLNFYKHFEVKRLQRFACDAFT